MPVCFMNEGQIDVEGAMMFGVNSKSCGSPIGFFGTGLKYSVAKYLSRNHSVDIYSGKDHYKFLAVDMEFRDKSFRAVAMSLNGGEPKKLSFTTELGKTWEGWMAYRELHSNALDEKGKVELVEESKVGELVSNNEGKTLIVVRGNDVEESYRSRHQIFCSSQVLASSDSLEVRFGASKYLYYRGVRVHEVKEPFKYTYNVLGSLDLTEDRSLKYQWTVDQVIGKGVASLTDKDVIMNIITSFAREKDLSIGSLGVDDVSEQFIDAVKSLRNDSSLIKGVREWSENAGLVEVREITKLPKLWETMIKRGISFLDRGMGIDVSRYPIKVVDFGGIGKLAEAKNGCIYLDKDLFNLGTKTVTLALLEEYTHLDTGFGDETRDLQTHLFNTILSSLENLLGEPI